jgi:mRNA-degrading endonuclease RelE of RelBE toxin-antitoxin system
MEFRIADSFIDSLVKLNNEDQKAVKTTVFDLQVDPANPGLNYHKLERTQDPNFVAVRASRDLRVIIHRTGNDLLICYVGHHEDAYQWASRRKLETHPTTGAAQMVEIRERVEEVIIPSYVVEERPKPPLFAGRSDEELLGYGIPPEWLEDVKAANEDSILEIANHLPGEAAEALLELAVGGVPVVIPTPAVVAPFDHPDALRRFRVMGDLDELARALEYPWEKWSVFLHPEQRKFVEGNYSGPARVSGSAGTGKTVVALHRAVFLARRNPEARVLLTTFSDPLANALKGKLRTLIFNQPRLVEQIEVMSMNAMAEHLYKVNFGKPSIVSSDDLKKLILQASGIVPGHTFSLHFLVNEWNQIVDAWQLKSWEAYRDVPRLGRRTRLTESQRRTLWEIFSRVLASLKEQGLLTNAGVFNRLTDHFSSGKHTPYDHIVVDEAQDINIPQLKVVAVLGATKPNGLFFAGDLGQRIFQQPFSWKSLGIDIRGRSKTLKINYRTSHQIRSQADKLLGPEITDVDGNTEKRRDTISVFNGPTPVIQSFDTEENEIRAVTEWLVEGIVHDLGPDEIGIFVRSEGQLPRAQAALDAAGLPYKILDQKIETEPGKASLCTMHLAKGLEFRAVVVMACDDEIVPLQARIETAADPSELEEVYNTERHLLYVACTRARDHLLVTSVEPASEFLVDLLG